MPPPGPLPPPPPDAVLLPAPGSSFLEQWEALPTLRELWIPVGLRSEMARRDLTEAEVFDHIDTGGSTYREGDKQWRVGLVCTDGRLLVPDVVVSPLPTATALRRFFGAEQLDGVAFNPLDDYSAFRTAGHVLLRFGIPRVAGLIDSPDPAALHKPHAQLAAELLHADRVLAAHHHAVLARESGAPLDSYFFTELDTLRLLGLWPQFQDYHAWYAKRGGRRLKRLDLSSGAALVMSGQPAMALETTAPFLSDAELAGRAWLERGRALFALGRPAEAIGAFDRALTLGADECETSLGKGIALRGLHWEAGDRDGLLAAAACFARVREIADHSAAEATHHLATIHLALGEWPEVERLSREAQRLKRSPVSRRNLVLSLHAQGRLEEAAIEYRFLSRNFPEQAEPLHKYFGEGG